MNATETALALGAKYIGSHGITQIDVRNANDPHIRVTFERHLDPHIRREIEQAAKPFHVKFKDTILRSRLRYVEK